MSSNGRTRGSAKGSASRRAYGLIPIGDGRRRDAFVHLSDIKSKTIGKLASTKSASWYKIPFDLCSLLEVPTRFITAWRGEPSWKRVFSASSARSLARV